MIGGAHGHPNKFRNQLQQFSSDNDVTPNHEMNNFLASQTNQGNVINSMSVKNDALFQNRGGILNRVKTQDATATENMIKQAAPARQKQDKIAQKALYDMQEKQKNLIQTVLKIKKTISDAQEKSMSESELKLLELVIGLLNRWTSRKLVR